MISLSAILSVIVLVMVAFAVIMVVANLFLAGRRGWTMGIVRIALTVIAVIAALPLARLVSEKLTDWAYDRFIPLLGDDVETFLNSIPLGTEGARTLVTMVAAPLLFALIFIVLRALLCIVGYVLGRVVPALRDKSLRAVSMPLGALNGLLIAMVVMVPLCGFITMGAHVLNDAQEALANCEPEAVEKILAGVGTTPEQVDSLTEEMNSQPVIKAVSYTVGRPVFSYLTTAQLDTTETHGEIITMNLEQEISGLACTCVYLFDAYDTLDKDDFVEADKECLYVLADQILESDWIRLMATDTLVNAATQWKAGKEFAGIGRPTVNASVDPTINCLLDILASEQTVTLDEDLHTLLDVVGDFLVCDLLTETDEPEKLLMTISENGLLDQTLTKLEANPRLSPLVGELRSMSVRLLTEMLGLDDLKNGEHAELMDTVAGELNGVLGLPEEERHEAISEAVSTTFKDYGYEVPEDVAIDMTDQMIEELGGDGEITGDEVSDYLVNHMDDTLDVLPEITDGDSGESLPEDLIDDLFGEETLA